VYILEWIVGECGMALFISRSASDETRMRFCVKKAFWKNPAASITTAPYRSKLNII
jgi:hypothetical protein